MKQNFKKGAFFGKFASFGFSFFPPADLEGSQVVGLEGPPGSGKTAIATKILLREQKKNHKIIFCNDDYINDFADYSFDPDRLGHYNFPRDSIVFIDEMSLNGYDCRNSNNFRDLNRLDFWKKHRQEGMNDVSDPFEFASGVPIIWTNQSFTETDIKVRDFLTTFIYKCENHGLFCEAVKLHKEERPNEITGKPEYYYYTKGFFYALFHRGERIICFPKKYGKHYKSTHPTPKININDALAKGMIKVNSKQL